MTRRFHVQLEHQGELHVHGCPECYELHPCRWACHIEPDLNDCDDAGPPLADYDLCPACEWTRCDKCGSRTECRDHQHGYKDRWCMPCGNQWIAGTEGTPGPDNHPIEQGQDPPPDIPPA